MFVASISGYYDHTGDFNPISPDFGYWLESDGPNHRYITDKEESVWVRFDEADVPWEVMDDEEEWTD